MIAEKQGEKPEQKVIAAACILAAPQDDQVLMAVHGSLDDFEHLEPLIGPGAAHVGRVMDCLLYTSRCV